LELTFYYTEGIKVLNATINGKALGRDAAVILRDAMSGGGSREGRLAESRPVRELTRRRCSVER
jgi:hypothetical protein